MVESQPSKLLVAGSIPVSRSNLRSLRELRLASQRGLSTEARSAKVEWQANLHVEATSRLSLDDQKREGRLVGRSREWAKRSERRRPM